MVFGSDLFDYGDPGQDLAGVDFLQDHPTEIPTGSFAGIITNPPFAHAAAFVERALTVAPYVAMLLRINFLESERRRHCSSLDTSPACTSSREGYR
jgi:hypothetical protein